MRPLTLRLAAALTLGLAAAAHAQRPMGEMTVHDFAAKWMMQQDDLADVGRYRAANAELMANGDATPRVVLMGDSITFRWTDATRGIPSSLAAINRGISGQNSSQMLLRFQSDVVALKPRAVVLMAGTNDLRVYAGDPAAAVPAMIVRLMDNITAMADIADARGIKMVLCALPPIGADRPELGRDPAAVAKVNARISDLARQRGYPFADYYAALADDRGTLPAALADDGLHPNAAGYERMAPVLAAALAKIKR